MYRSYLNGHLLRRILCAAALATVGLPAIAQQKVAVTEEPQLQVVVVTGSRIASRIAAPNAVSASPIQAVTALDIQASGKTDISDVLYQLPQLLNNDLGQDFSNRTVGLSTPGGVTTADLRGNRPQPNTGVGRWAAAGQGSRQTTIASPAPDLDQIPSALVERVEVLTGGASSTYGSDAIAGVVNFIMKKNFEGVQVDGQFGEDWHNNRNDAMKKPLTDAGYTPLSGNKFDGKSKNFDIVAGTNFNDGAGNITGYVTYTHFDPVASAERDYGQCQLTETSETSASARAIRTASLH